MEGLKCNCMFQKRFSLTKDSKLSLILKGVGVKSKYQSGRKFQTNALAGGNDDTSPEVRVFEVDDAYRVPGNTSERSKMFQGSNFVKPLSEMYPRLPCRVCEGRGHLACEQCDGKGNLQKGGYHKRNPVTLSRIVGSRWTAMERTFGWRHFEVRSRMKLNGKDWFLEMVATCDGNSRFWVNSKNLKDRERWSMGWLQKAEIEAAHRELEDGSLACKACRGLKIVPCLSCLNTEDEEAELDVIEV